MKWKIKDLHTCLNLICAFILVVGLSSAIYIYNTAEDDSYGILGYEIIGGSVYPILPENSKIYEHNLELYGGKAAVFADDLRLWFVRLWQGKSLAYTTACITMFISLLVFIAAKSLPSRIESDVPFENDRDRTD
jgi:hypothetical protein